ncbi:tRNA lysidine(34) synthetase TilS [Aestuariicella hydrocarbonica]|uniref:tRNA(Ile)-lysidine synthase n=1 Tax=Pseudomaricurvus hydrocarbonicus TaxID=1470433 RepID=A0A9E5JXQ6_9GAMM|nr:tRNA lysidine(34) synthetase TilS [Aestuariicella hydrocarbonica]NHO63992.1 tRNA lysidine(34) synthetase TilS [Aestuariicella hydrocarbonica]
MPDMPAVLEILHQFVRENPSVKRWWVAYSGGLDSSVLLRALVEAERSRPVLALHVNHGLSAQADAWQEHCQRECDALGVALTAETVRVEVQGRGLEDAARQARYQVFEQYLQPGDGLLLGHHQDDQAETVLLRLLRGSGPKGLAGMASERVVGAGRLYRPLLGLNREALEQQARQWCLSWVDDDSNRSLGFDRNYVRHAVMPAIQQRWPDVAERWRQSSEVCRQSHELIEEIAAEDWQKAGWQAERLGSSLDLSVLQGLSEFRRGNVIRYWLQQQGRDLPERVHLQQVEAQLVWGREDSEAEVLWGRSRLRRFRQRLYLLPPQLITAQPAVAECWDGLTPLVWGHWQLRLEPQAEGGFRRPTQGFQVVSRQGGERCQPFWRNKSQTLKKLLQEASLEPWLRAQLPILRVDGEIAVVGDLWFCRGWEASATAAGGAEPGYRLCWQALGDR